jgi:hypothetical protein
MPDIHFECPKCKQPIDAPEELVAQLIECPTCKETIEVPVCSQPKPKAVPASPAPTPPTPPKFELPPIEDSGVATALTIIAVLEFIGAVIGGLVVGIGDRRYVSAEHSDVGVAYSTSTGRPEIGWLIFCSGILSALILLGFARVIQNTFESSQRLRRLEILMERDYDKKRAT